MKLAERVKRTRKEIVKKTCELVSIPTYVPPGNNYAEAAEWLAAFLSECGAKVSKLTAPSNLSTTIEAELSGPRVNVVGEYDLGEGPSIILAGHYDVVPVKEEKWESPPFKPTERNGSLFGRGTADQKGSLVSAIIAIRELVENQPEAISGKIVVAATPDEEVGGEAGFGWLIKEKTITADACLVTDGGMETLIIAANGTLRARLKTHGKSGHSSQPWHAQNAIHDMIPVMSQLLELSKQIEKRESTVKYKRRDKIINIRPCLNLDVIHAGVKANIIPDECTLLLDRRVTPDEDANTAKEEITRIIENERSKNPELNLTYEHQMLHGNFVSPSNFRYLTALKKAYREVKGELPFVGGSTGALDACYSVQEGIPTVTFGSAGPDSNAHGPNESVRIEDLVTYSQIVSFSLAEYLAVK